MKDIEEQLTDLQERHSELIQMYKTLQLECSATRQEMETLRQKYESNSPTPGSFFPCGTELKTTQTQHSDHLLFDFSEMFYELKQEGH